MNLAGQIKPSLTLKDIWSDDQVSCDNSDDCFPQIPKVTHQFKNTLKDNKGKLKKEDFIKNLEIPCKGQLSKDDTIVIGKSTGFKTCSKHNPHAKKLKPLTFSSFVPRRNSKELKKIPSSEILQLLLSCKEI
ncbi:unnamed protein product [Moneuplotes crassus]|uniref:Uncharacterized protein n=1 Tax=Euplotes crassus TaxID=5936 RepID=A0AAD1U4N1_EUPCR|nr:unnamed protein product [Moneuplotes crassus]